MLYHYALIGARRTPRREGSVANVDMSSIIIIVGVNIMNTITITSTVTSTATSTATITTYH